MRQLTKTPEIVKMLQDLISPDVNLDTLAVYETVALNTNPVSKRGTLFDKAIVSHSLIRKMAEFISSERKIPLQIMHDTSTTPVGTVFDAKTFTTSDAVGKEGLEMRQLFYINNTTQDGADLIAKLDAGVINEVSVNFNPTHIRCSQCGFDYNGPEADFWDNIMTRTCPNGHTLGQDGVYANLDGLNKYWETSLVNVGAADHARIASPAEAKMLKESMQLAASATGSKQCKNLTISLIASGSSDMPPVNDQTQVPAADLPATDPTIPAQDPAPTEPAPAGAVSFSVTFDNFVELKAQNKIISDELATLKASHTATLTELAAAKEAAAKLVTVEADKTKAVEFLKTSYQNLMVASGATGFTVPNDVQALMDGISSAQAQLSKLPVGGVSTPADINPTVVVKTTAVDAFKTKS